MKKWRINLIFIFIILFGAVLLGRLVYIQIIQGDLYRALAFGQQKDFQPSVGERGEIFFSGGEILAANVKGSYIFLCPDKIEEKEKTAQKLSEILRVEKEFILEKINRDSLFEKITTELTKETEEIIKELALPGVFINEAVFRKYPQEEMASQTIGFFGGDEQGQYGLEGFYDDILQGEEEFQKKADNGADIFLSLNYNLQFMAEKLLREAKDNLNIESGQIIVAEPNTGRILALADFPNFNPNHYSEIEDFQVFQNGAHQKLFEPGSAFKPITLAAAIDEGKIAPDDIFDDQGKVKIGQYTIYNYNKRVWGERTMTEILEKSINTGAVFVEKKLGHNNFLKYTEKFGFFEPTKIDLQGEVFSENKEFRKGYEINFATASFGQGIEITPIQLIRAFCAIANGGKLVKLHLAEKIVKGGEIIYSFSGQGDQVISLKTASQIGAMLISVVENGFARAAKIDGYYIAGKTGTAQIPWTTLGINKKGYSDKTWQSFIGFFPAFSPRFLVLIKLDNPETRTAEYSAVPVFKKMAKYIIDYYQIPPDHE